MKKLFTQQQVEQAKYPTQLQVLQEKNKRQALDENQKSLLYRLEQGLMGEQTVLKLIEEYGPAHWKVLTNLWLSEYGKFEIDLLLITSINMHAIEIKNYNGNFEYKNSQCFYEGKVIGQNPISQAQKIGINLRNILKHSGFEIDVKGALVFTGPHCDVHIHDTVDGLSVLMVNQLRKYLLEIAAEEKLQLNKGCKPMDLKKVMATLEKYETVSPFQPEPLSAIEKSKMKRGLQCANCGSFNIDTSQSYFICDCGFHEPREMTIVRTICEYGVLHFNQDLVSSEVHDFFGGSLSRKTVIRYLKLYFKQVGSRRGTKYKNRRLPFLQIIHQFLFTRARYLRF